MLEKEVGCRRRGAYKSRAWHRTGCLLVTGSGNLGAKYMMLDCSVELFSVDKDSLWQYRDEG